LTTILFRVKRGNQRTIRCPRGLSITTRRKMYGGTTMYYSQQGHDNFLHILFIIIWEKFG